MPVQEKVLTREEYKQIASPKPQTLQGSIIRLRLIPIWLRLVLLIMAIPISIVIGSLIGYSVIGDGKPAEVFQKETWLHIVDLVRKDT